MTVTIYHAVRVLDKSRNIHQKLEICLEPWMKSNSLELIDLVVAREGAPLTPSLSTRLSGGEILVVRGSNGAGKSTLLKTLAGLLPVGGGAIQLNGAWPTEVKAVYIGHRNGLVPTLNVEDNVALWGKLSGFSELTSAALHYFDLEDIADVPVAKLSAGWQQRVALTRLITQQSNLWLLDEPTSNLDSDGINLLHTLMQTRLEQGGMIVVASHMDMQGEMVKTININKLN